MQKPLPNWEMWKHIPRLNATHAVALTLNVDPFKVYERSKLEWAFNWPSGGMCSEVTGFSDRLFLFKMCFGERTDISLKELAEWSQSVDWNIPTELAALAPLPRTVYDPVPAGIVQAALAPLIAPGEAIDELELEMANEGLRFVIVDDTPTIHIQDGTVRGRFAPIRNLYAVLGEICNTSKNSRIGHLVRSSGASGGGATHSKPLATELERAIQPEPQATNAHASPALATCAVSPDGPDAPNIQNGDLEPWRSADPRDKTLKAFEPWGTPARYFARKFVKENNSLRNKRPALAKKVADALASVRVTKRGGVNAPDPATILKAFANLDFS